MIHRGQLIQLFQQWKHSLLRLASTSQRVPLSPLQCLRRLFEEKDPIQGYNGLKYFSTIVAVSLRTAYSLNKGMRWRIVAWVSSAIAAIASTYWDLVFDWGLLQKHAKNRWLRDKLLVPHKSVYFGAMVRIGRKLPGILIGY